MPTARRLNHVHILVSDLERSISFYTKAFGLKEAFREEEEGEILVFLWTEDQDVLTLHDGVPDRAGQRGGVLHFGFQVPGPLEDVITAIEVNGGSFARDGWANGVAYVHDPDGYEVEIDARSR